MVVCCFDVLSRVLIDALTSGHELGVGVGGQVTNSVCDNDLVGVAPVFVLERFTEDLYDLVNCLLRITREKNLGLLQNHLCNEFKLRLGLLNIVRDWQKINPIAGEFLVQGSILLHDVLLVLEYLANTSNRIVSCVVEGS